ncbi:hypothetical protein JFL57_03560 [Histophilus somni]|uniref:hypothetical protein n=1 Tax=Histophilus somni TaxID=731 RepID=UPI0018EB488B|nr:hypothetical protein [Histophilus somni]QQF91653.1 hypothetical protein JFL57_03560 [Histophilus somni]
MKRLRKLSVLAFVAMFATGCATIVSKRDYNVSIHSNPSNAYFVIKNRAGKVITSGKTPQNVVLPAGAGYFKGEKYEITFTPEGKNAKSQTFLLEAKLDGWYIGNFVFGGLIGLLIVDPITGAMYKLPDYFHADLGLNNKTGLHIISTDVLTTEQKSKLEPIQL